MSFKGHMPRFEGLQKIAPRQPDNLSRSQKLFWRHGWLQANLLEKKTNKGEHSNVFPSIPLDLHFQLVSLDAGLFRCNTWKSKYLHVLSLMPVCDEHVILEWTWKASSFNTNVLHEHSVSSTPQVTSYKPSAPWQKSLQNPKPRRTAIQMLSNHSSLALCSARCARTKIFSFVSQPLADLTA